MAKKIAVQCGHGTSTDGSWDSGCVYGKYTEAGLMLKITKVAVKYVERYTISAPSFNLYVALCGGISAARKQRVVSQYYKEHPDSKLTEKEIIANYRKGR